MSIRPRFRQLYAELAALPLASMEGFLHCVSCVPFPIEAAGSSIAAGGASALFLDSERLAKSYSLSTNELADLRDWIWFGREASTKISLSSYLERLASDNLAVSGSDLRPRIRLGDLRHELSDKNQQRFARESFSWLSREMPIDLLEASLATDCLTNSISNRIDKLLEKQFAEIHLHLGASVNFESQWSYLQGALRNPDLPFDFLKTPHGFFDKGRKFGTWVLVSSIVRLLLAKFVATSGDKVGFNEFLGRSFRQLSVGGVNVELLRHVIASFRTPCLHDFDASPQLFRQLQSLYQQMVLPQVGVPNSFRELKWLDPIHYYVRPRKVSCERRFVTSSLARIKALSDVGSPDDFFEPLFWQTQRIRTLFYRHLVQRQSVAGLVWFTRYYRRISPSKKGAASDALQFVGGAINSGFGFGLKSFEVRGAPPSSADLVAADIDQIRVGALALNTQRSKPPDERELEVSKTGHRQVKFVPVEFEAGLVYHFVKARERGDADTLSALGRDRHDKVTSNAVSKYRYGDYFMKLQKKSKATADAIRIFPLSLLWLRAVDICNDELAMPTWLFCNAYKEIIDASIESSQYLYKQFGKKIRPIRPNSHVGEDFSHLLTGLRRIDECLENLGICEGDRIGHGLALGTEPLTWAVENGPVAMTREERLFDLIWARSATVDTSGPFRRWELEINRLIDVIFNSIPPEHRPDSLAIERMCANLTDLRVLKKIGFPDQDPLLIRKSFGGNLKENSHKNDLVLLFSFLTDADIADAASTIVLIDPDLDKDAVLALQDSLRTKVALRGVAVEVNPTSNLVVANYDDLSKHPMWRLNRPGYSDEIPPVSLCIGSDDPLVFSTNLPLEYQRLSDALGQSGFSDVQIDEWLDRVREKSLEVRNTLSETSFAPVNSIRRR